MSHSRPAGLFRLVRAASRQPPTLPAPLLSPLTFRVRSRGQVWRCKEKGREGESSWESAMRLIGFDRATRAACIKRAAPHLEIVQHSTCGHGRDDEGSHLQAKDGRTREGPCKAVGNPVNGRQCSLCSAFGTWQDAGSSLQRANAATGRDGAACLGERDENHGCFAAVGAWEVLLALVNCGLALGSQDDRGCKGLRAS